MTTFLLLVLSLLLGDLARGPIQAGVAQESPVLIGSYTANETLASNAHLWYRVDQAAETIAFGLAITDKGVVDLSGPNWLGLGIGEVRSGGMLGADIVTAEFGPRDATSCTVKDRYVPFVSFPLTDPPRAFPLEDECGESDWRLVNCARDEGTGKMVLEVERNLKGRDEQDRDITEGDNQILHAYGRIFSYHGKSRSTKTVQFFGEPQRTDIPPDTDGNQTFRSTAYEVPTNTTTYACTALVADVPDGEEIMIIGGEPLIEPENDEHVHHMILYACEDNDYFKRHAQTRSCSGDGPLGNPEAACKSLMYGWAKGATRFIYPEETGLIVNSKNKFFILEVHYDNPARESGIVDSSGARLFYTKTLRPIPGSAMVLGDVLVSRSGDIVESDREYVSTCPSECTSLFTEPVNVIGSGLHMHQTGREIWTNQYYANGTLKARRESIAFWSDRLQRIGKTNKWKIDPGDQLITTCTYDTSKLPETKWGPETTDEMCMHFLFVYPVPRRRDTGSQVYYCGYLRFNSTDITLCGPADRVSEGVIGQAPSLPNPKFKDTAGLEDSFGNVTTCRALSTSPGLDVLECFPGSATVELDSGKIVTMADLVVGDRVKVGPGQFSEVYVFSHRDPFARTTFIRLVVASESKEDYSLTASPGHLVHTRGGLVAMNEVKIGDELFNENGNIIRVISRTSVESVGLYSPHTMEGNIVVNGVIASTYTNVLPERLAHLLLLPERISYRLGFSVFGANPWQVDKMGLSRPFVIEAAVRVRQMFKNLFMLQKNSAVSGN